MKRNPEIVQELQDLGVNLPPASNPYSIPDTYFDTFYSSLQEELAVEHALDAFPKTNPYQLNENYFESLESELQSRIFLESISKEMPMELPPSYFSQFESTLQSKLKTQTPELKPMRKVSPMFSFVSIAASIVLVLGLAFWMMNQHRTLSVEQQLARISTSEIQAYMNAHQEEFGTEVSFENVEESQIDIMSLEQEVYGNFDLNNMSSEELKKYVF